jgi:hypothetical protein
MVTPSWLGDQVDERIPLAPVRDVADTARDDDLQLWPRGFELLERMQLAVHAVLGTLAHDARVQHDHVRLGGRLSRVEPVPFQAFSEPPRIGHVHLAANRPDVKCTHREGAGL